MDLKDKSTLVAVVIFMAIVFLAFLGNVIGKDYKINSILFVLILLGILYVIFKLIMVIEKKVVLSIKEFAILIGIAAVLILLLLVLFKQLVPENFLGAIQGIEQFAIARAPL